MNVNVHQSGLRILLCPMYRYEWRGEGLVAVLSVRAVRCTVSQEMHDTGKKGVFVVEARMTSIASRVLSSSETCVDQQKYSNNQKRKRQ